MKVILIYFSQTGNTRVVAETMAEGFREGGHVARLIRLSKALPQDATTCDLLGIGSPCFSSQAPTPVKEFLGTLPPLHKQRAFVFATSAGAPGRVLADLSSLLQAKGAEVIGGFLARGACHYPAPSLTGRFPHRPNSADLSEVKLFAASVSEHALADRPGLAAGSRPDTFKPGSRFYNAIARISTDKLTRLIMPEPKLDPDRCDQCQWCAYACPMHNITLQPHPHLGQRCIRCYRCLTGCPEKAFTVRWGLADPVLWLFYHPILERWFSDLRPGEHIY